MGSLSENISLDSLKTVTDSDGQTMKQDENMKENITDLPPHVLHQVDHFKQRYNWDCGVSCVLMLLTNDQRAHFLNNFEAICQEEGFAKSTWTIDLCYLLKRFGIKHCMYSTMIGVNEDYKKFKYYDSIMELDKHRVQQRFEEAAAQGISIRFGSLSAVQLRQHLSSRGPAILLVDAGLLVCDLCKHNKLRVEFRRCFGGNYSGHYILVVGYRGDRFVFRDPARGARLCAAPAARLRRAHRASGTDCDALLVGGGTDLTG